MSYNSYEDYLPQRPSTVNHSKNSVGSKQKQKHRRVNKKNKPSIQSPSNHKGVKRYIVRTGDTLFSIAKKHGVTVASLGTCNGIKNHNRIKKGMVLKIPAGTKKIGRRSTPSTKKGKQPFSRPDRPRFRWPVNKISAYKQDDIDGVKPIGIIITGKPGSRVISSAPGVVKKIGHMRGFGNYIVIHHAGRYATVYANVTDIAVSVGDNLQAGNVIGTINPKNRRLHFQIDLSGKPENPLDYLPKKI